MKKVLFVLLSLLVMAVAVSCDSSATVSANAVIDFSDVELKEGDKVVIDVTCGSKSMPSLEFEIKDPSKKTPKYTFKAIKRTSGTIDVEVYRKNSPFTKSDTEEYLIAEGSAEVTEFSEGDTCDVSTHHVVYYQVIFLDNGGSELFYEYIPRGSYAWEPYPEPTKTGYTLEGWYTDSALQNRYLFNSPMYSDMYLYAKWLYNYTVSFNSNGGSEVSSQQVADGRCACEPSPEPTKTNYSLDGWYTDSALKNKFSFSTPVKSDMTLYAKWLYNYTVSFNSNGGSEVSSQIVPDGRCASEPSPEPTRTDYTFDGWYSDSALKNKFSFSTPVKSNMTLYAKWIFNNCIVTFLPMDGSPTFTQIVVPGECASEPLPIPQALGYVFVGWFRDLEYKNEYDFSTPVTEDITIIGKLVPYDSDKNYVGGRIFYIAGDNGAEYRFYNERGEELTEQTVEGLEKAFTYTKSGSSDSDKFYVLNPNGSFEVEWGAYGTYVGVENEGIGAGKKNYKICMNNSACWWPDEEGHLTVYSWVFNLINGYATSVCNDWYVPSFAEMTKLRNSCLADKWGIREYNYLWTSEEGDIYNAATFVNDPDSGETYKKQRPKCNLYPSFAIRSF